MFSSITLFHLVPVIALDNKWKAGSGFGKYERISIDRPIVTHSLKVLLTLPTTHSSLLLLACRRNPDIGGNGCEKRTLDTKQF